MLLEELRAEFKVFMKDLVHIKKTSEAVSEMICALRENAKAMIERDAKSGV